MWLLAASLFLVAFCLHGVSASSEGWQTTEQFDADFYFDASTTRNYTDAKKHCASLNSSLPQFSTLGEQLWVVTYVSMGKWFWMNAMSVPNSNNYTGWANGAQFNYTDWNNGQPGNPTKGSPCNAIAYFRNKWVHRPCPSSANIFTACQRKKDTVSLVGDSRVEMLERKLALANQKLDDHIAQAKESTDRLNSAMEKFFLNAGDSSRDQLEQLFAVIRASEQTNMGKANADKEGHICGALTYELGKEAQSGHEVRSLSLTMTIVLLAICTTLFGVIVSLVRFRRQLSKVETIAGGSDSFLGFENKL